MFSIACMHAGHSTIRQLSKPSVHVNACGKAGQTGQARRAMRRLFIVGWMLLSAASAYAATPSQSSVNWHTDVTAAWKQTKQQGRPLLIFVTHENCVFCTKMKKGTLANGQVEAKIGAGYVPLVIDGGGKCPLLKELNVKAYPATFVVSPDAVILDRIDGYVTPDVLARRLAKQSTSTQVAKSR
jgi:thiol:disulfide interchange protein